MSIFDDFNKAFNTETLKNDVKEAAENGGGNFKEVPTGNYEVAVEKLELVASKSKREPMVSAWFKIVAGDFKGQRIFMNQVITQGFQVHIVNEFLRSLKTGLEIVFDDYNQYHNLLLDVKEAIDTQKLEYNLKYGKTNKGFNTFEIEEVFEADA